MNEFDNLEKKVLIKGHCGHYHSEEECEVVIVKIVKGKACQLDSSATSVFSTTTSTETHIAPTKDIQIESTSPVPIKKNILPPSIVSMMYPPGDPMHESKGAKEIRRV